MRLEYEYSSRTWLLWSIKTAEDKIEIPIIGPSPAYRFMRPMNLQVDLYIYRVKYCGEWLFTTDLYVLDMYAEDFCYRSKKHRRFYNSRYEILKKIVDAFAASTRFSLDEEIYIRSSYERVPVKRVLELMENERYT